MFTITRLIMIFAAISPFGVVAACAEQPEEPSSNRDVSVTDSATSNDTAVDQAQASERLVQIARLETPQANDEFTRNVQIMQARVREVANLNTLLSEEQDPEAKKDIQNQIDELMRRINEDDKLMVETYRYSLSRRYIRNIEQATVFLILSDEEVEAIQADAIANDTEEPDTLNSNMLEICTLNTSEAAQGFQRDVAAVQVQRDIAVQLQADLDKAETPEDRAYAQGKLDQVLIQLNTLNQAMVKAYGFSINRNYILRINKSSLYVWATEDELVETAQVE